MRAARLENNVVVDLWEVPSLDCYGDLYELVEAPDFVAIGDSYAGGFVDSRVIEELPPISGPTKEQLMLQLAAISAQIQAME